VVAAVTDHRGAPHARLLASDLMHQVHQRSAVIAEGFAGLFVYEGIDAGGGGVSLVGLPGHQNRGL
jgi:hypothetical protein